MRPTLIDFFGMPFHSYPTMLAIAFLSCTMLAVRDLQRADPPVFATTQGGLWAFLGALLGAKVFWILQFKGPWDVWRAVFIWQGGLVFYGGLVGGIIGMLAYLKINKLPVIRVAEGAAPYIALGEAITRIGCFLNGCCWGDVTTLPWGVRFPMGSHPYEHQLALGLIERSARCSLPAHPTQLYMTFGLILAFFLIKAAAKRGPTGTAFVAYLFFYGIVRFSVELLRASDRGGDSVRSVMGMTVSQTISAVFVALSLILVLAYKSGVFRLPERLDALEPVISDASLANCGGDSDIEPENQV